MNIKSAHLLTALAGRIVRQVGRNLRPNISADFVEIFGRIFGFGRTLIIFNRNTLYLDSYFEWHCFATSYAIE